MLPASRTATRQQRLNTTYVCLSCRLQTRKRGKSTNGVPNRPRLEKTPFFTGAFRKIYFERPSATVQEVATDHVVPTDSKAQAVASIYRRILAIERFFRKHYAAQRRRELSEHSAQGPSLRFYASNQALRKLWHAPGLVRKYPTRSNTRSELHLSPVGNGDGRKFRYIYALLTRYQSTGKTQSDWSPSPVDDDHDGSMLAWLGNESMQNRDTSGAAADESIEALLDEHRNLSEKLVEDVKALNAQARCNESTKETGLDALLRMSAASSRQGRNGRRELEVDHFGISHQATSSSLSRSSSSSTGALFRPSKATGAMDQARQMHTSSNSRQQAAAAAAAMAFESARQPPPPSLEQISKKDSPIRTQLRQWQELYEKQGLADQLEVPDFDETETFNDLTRLPPVRRSFQRQDLEEEEERQALAHFMRSSSHDLDSGATDSRFLKMGDLVELEFPQSERESVIAVFVQRLGQQSQFFTMHGRWAHLPERRIQYSIPGWVSPNLVKPILPYLPDPQSLQETEELNEQAYMHDLTVPREVAAGLVSRMVQFHTESLEIYRRHASTLDNAHAILSHDTDLRYGSLLSATTTLLQMRADQLPVTALFTVRKALARAGLAFNFDRRSHRLTGYLQIRSKEQVENVEQVRRWLRDWQDDMAKRSALDGETRKRAPIRTSKTAQYVYDFLEKAKKIVLMSRKNRDATPFGNVGPSKKQMPLTLGSDCVSTITEWQFTAEDTELVKFMEAWSCSHMFVGLPRIEALPPLLLQATGLYENMELSMKTGFVFLQELGTIMPYENRVRFDQHLLLPSSRHSKPLQTLMASLHDMRDRHNLSDSMKHLRHDWKDLTVYCIDDAGAHEIDDGVSIQQAGSDTWWVHVHIANPTAFFERDHPLAKMARHMGESVYMPERTYMMLPRWATTRHFSLSKGRPCLTFSTKMDAEGNTLDRKVQSGIVRNVVQLTPKEVTEALGFTTGSRPKIALTVGGDVNPPIEGKSAVPTLTAKQLKELKMLQQFAEKRSNTRRRAGGVFFDMNRPDIRVWQKLSAPGLSSDNSHWKGSRIVEGDPVIQMRTQELANWFQPQENYGSILVREMMLLACETAASWCLERDIPAIFRGTLRRPDQPDPDVLRREILEPAVEESPDGAYPMHLGMLYIQALGGTVLASKPFRHALLGMEHYGKVTSPLRRYGDMILHWQIEAALREEARTGKSLITEKRNSDRSFLPFSRSTLDTIMLGLHPRESIVSRAKMYTEAFWTSMVLFRAFHYGEHELPFHTAASPTKPDGTPKPLMRCFIHSQDASSSSFVNGISVDLNVSMNLLRPSKHGLGDTKLGDIWECELDHVDVYRRTMVARPIRLVHREKIGAQEVKDITAKYVSTF